MGTPTAFLLLPAPRVAHMWDTDYGTSCEAAPRVWHSAGSSKQDQSTPGVISSSHPGPTLAQQSSAASESDLAYQLLRTACVRREEAQIPSPFLSSAEISQGVFLFIRQASSWVLRGGMESPKLIHPGQRFRFRAHKSILTSSISVAGAQ